MFIGTYVNGCMVLIVDMLLLKFRYIILKALNPVTKVL